MTTGSPEGATRSSTLGRAAARSIPRHGTQRHRRPVIALTELAPVFRERAEHEPNHTPPDPRRRHSRRGLPPARSRARRARAPDAHHVHPRRPGHALGLGVARRHALGRRRRRGVPRSGDRAVPRRRPGARVGPRGRSRPGGRGHGRRQRRRLRRGHRLHAAAAAGQGDAPEPGPPRRGVDGRRRHPCERDAVAERPHGARTGSRRRACAAGGRARLAMQTRTTWREDMVAALTGGLLVLGLFLDGWNHLNLQNGEAGSFLTPWHGLLYAGFNACAIWAITRNPRLKAMLLPAGLPQLPALTAPRLAAAGLGLAGAGMAAGADVALFGGLAVVLCVALHAAAGAPAL